MNGPDRIKMRRQSRASPWFESLTDKEEAEVIAAWRRYIEDWLARDARVVIYGGGPSCSGGPRSRDRRLQPTRDVFRAFLGELP